MNVLNKLLRGSRLYEHPEPAQRALGVTALARDSEILVQMLRADPSPEVRKSAATHCDRADVLAAAVRTETDATVRDAIVSSLGAAIAAAETDATAQGLLAATDCDDIVRTQVALHARDLGTRRAAVEAITDERLLVDVALGAEQAAVRLAAAERVHSPELLERLHEGVKDRDRGVARMARERLQAIQQRIVDTAAADALLQEAEALVSRPGPVVMAAVELDRRWRTLALGDDADRLARWDATSRLLRERFEREWEEERRRTRFAERLQGWTAALATPSSPGALPALRNEWAELRGEAEALGNTEAVARLDGIERQFAQWEQSAPAIAAAEALVAEAEGLAAGTTIDDAQLAARWQALPSDARVPALNQRLEAALAVIEQRRTALARGHQEQQGAARQELHTVLHQAELAVAAGQLHEARAAADRVRALKPSAGLLPKPTVQRLSRVVNQLIELERWQQFGQQSARVQLCERAEALIQSTLAPTAMARDVQQLRAEWKKLDEEQPGVPKALWERFDGACSRAYAPAAKHFAEQAALHKQARKAREEFIAAAGAAGAALLVDAPDWRAVEHWLRDTEAAWRGKTLGSVEPGLWKKLDARLKEALAPARGALAAARAESVKEREALIAAAEELVPKAAERDIPTRVKELQARWQANAKSIVLPQREERMLWERFRGAFQSVFDARTGQRKETDERKTAQRRAFESLSERMEQLAQSTGTDEAELKRARHELQDEWRKATADNGAAPAPVEARFKAALRNVEGRLQERAHAGQAAVWQALLAREVLCEELDAHVASEQAADAFDSEALLQRWSALPALSPEWEKTMVARRDASLSALTSSEPYAREDHADRIRDGANARRDTLLELELMLGIESPADLQAERLAVQVRELRDRFKRTAVASSDSAAQLLVKWCGLPGVSTPRDRARVEAVAARVARGGEGRSRAPTDDRPRPRR